MKILIPDDAPFQLQRIEGVEVAPYDPRSLFTDDQLEADAAVVWGFAAANLAQLAAAPALRWVQTLTAGPDGVLAAGFGSQVAITSGRGFHDRTVTEHALTLTLAGLRQIPKSLAAQREHRWAGAELGGFRPLHTAHEVTTLIGSKVLIWGFGSIGQSMAPLFQALGAEVRGVARTAGERAGFEVIAETDLLAALSRTDVLVMVLPTSEETHHALNAERLSALPSRAWVVNVGRGSTIDETALVAALREGRLGGAALDVTEVEPLPADSPLWDAPNVIITPHSAGGRPIGAGELITRNIHAYLAGRPLENLIQR